MLSLDVFNNSFLNVQNESKHAEKTIIVKTRNETKIEQSYYYLK